VGSITTSNNFFIFVILLLEVISFVSLLLIKWFSNGKHALNIYKLKLHFIYILLNCHFHKKTKVGGLDLSRRGLNRDSRSRHQKKVSLDGRENLDSFKKLVSTMEISRSRLRNLDFVSTRPKSPKSLDRDQEISQDMTFLANLDSLSRSRSRVSQCYHISRSRFLNLSRFLSLKSQKSLEKVSIMSRNLKNSR
jgi:hypothetical protein